MNKGPKIRRTKEQLQQENQKMIQAIMEAQERLNVVVALLEAPGEELTYTGLVMLHSIKEARSLTINSLPEDA